ncbi:uncharacterized protein LACBIDRAFT_336249 [Laccaria bicolor S238N-H82]|uniref:Predicted protein n=1 Tax=Laccaria bicolor (strain S238N-H82 / ATCC MYA-4686) TaxID=486041 RepID=B0E4V9_LACBS|nr:uncharacterized protein LACBIDRAFT_336249 [Laccaria bicolor S238N-H82]EDQ98122.1 predicted protein [Laccaria bicolor S238N-H82]|eukprot:XP_001891228.1 predicted protein [Laccaria bicolor S238N-H82]
MDAVAFVGSELKIIYGLNPHPSYPNGANAIYTLLNKVGPNACFYLKHDHSIQLPQLILYVCHCLQKSISSSQTHLIFPIQYPVGYSGLFQWVDIKTEDFIHWLCRSTCGNIVLPPKDYVHSIDIKTEDFVSWLCRSTSGNIVLPLKEYVHSTHVKTEDLSAGSAEVPPEILYQNRKFCRLVVPKSSGNIVLPLGDYVHSTHISKPKILWAGSAESTHVKTEDFVGW